MLGHDQHLAVPVARCGVLHRFGEFLAIRRRGDTPRLLRVGQKTALDQYGGAVLSQQHGHEVATNGYGHQRVYTMTPEIFRQDLKKSVSVISQITGSDITGYRAPEWSIRDDSLWALDILKQEGFVYDSSMAPLPIIGNPGNTRTPHLLSLKGGRLWEVPPLVAATPLVNLPLGGGWGLRTFPYRLIRSSIRRLNRRAQPALVYLHPREFDLKSPRIQLPLITRFVLHAGVERTERRLARLLDDFTFTTVSEILEQLAEN